MPARRVSALLVGAGLALGPAAVLAPAAYADGAITTPGSGTAYTDDTTVRIEARVDARTAPSTLQLVEPGGAVHTVDSVGQSLQAQTMSFALDTSCPAYPGLSCSGRRPAPNGTWTVRLGGGSSDSRSFSLRIAPQAPQGVAASATGPRTVVVTWDRGAESDLTGYAVVDGDGAKVADGDEVCAGGTCRTTVTYDTDGPRTENLAVRAARSCPDCGGPLSTTSAPVRVDRPAPPPPPAPEPTTGGGTTGGGTTDGGSAGGTDSGASGGSTPAPDASASSGTTGGTGGAGTSTGGTSGDTAGTTGGTAGPTAGGTPSTGGPAGATSGTGTGGTTGAAPGSATTGAEVPLASTPAQSANDFALTFKAFGPKLGLPKLPPLPATGVALPSVATTLPDGSYNPNLPFGQKEVTEKVPTTASGPVGRVSDAVSSVVDQDRLLRSVAGALVLLLAGAHVRRFLAQSPTDL